MQIQIKTTRPRLEKVEIKHRHTLSNWALWEAQNYIYMSESRTTEVLTNKGLIKWPKNGLDTFQVVICKICKKSFTAIYNHVRWERSKKTKEYLPA